MEVLPVGGKCDLRIGMFLVLDGVALLKSQVWCLGVFLDPGLLKEKQLVAVTRSASFTALAGQPAAAVFRQNRSCQVPYVLKTFRSHCCNTLHLVKYLEDITDAECCCQNSGWSQGSYLSRLVLLKAAPYLLPGTIQDAGINI